MLLPEAEGLETERKSGTDACRVSVVVPTYCEADNLPLLVPRVAQALASAGVAGEILIVDDNSPDHTLEVCKQLERHYPVRLLVRRHERGLSGAVLAGIRQAAGELVLVMDADLSHPPEKVPELVAALEEKGVDFVIGSRYVEGASTEENWGLFRWLNSRVATWLARPLTSVRDPMAGFFAFRKTILQKAAPLDPVGYKIGLELLVKCGCREPREIAIAFKDRLHGTSKLSFKEQINYLRHLKRLFEYRWGSVLRPAQFALVGLSGVAVDLLCFALLGAWLPLAGARAVAIWLAMTWNFVLNRRLTFSAFRSHKPWWVQYPLFCGACLAGALINWSVSLGLCRMSQWFDDHRSFAAVAGVAAGFVLNYCFCRRFVFRKSIQRPV
jgi:dolichol-phosphate mannosyltransferase